MQIDGKTFLRVLKGAPLSCLIALWLDGPMNQAQLKRRTGYDRKVLKDALEFLEDCRLVNRPNYRKWSLDDGFRQLPFANFRQLESGKSPLSAPPSEMSESGKSPLSAPESGDSPSSALVVSSRPTTNNGASQLLAQPDVEILAVCRELGIYGKKAAELARLPHVVEQGVDYVRAHVTALPAKDKGLAIWRMTQGWARPKSADSVSDDIPEHLRDIIIH